MDNAKNLARRSLAMWAATTPFKPEEVFAPGYQNHQEPLADGGVRTVDLATWERVVKENHDAFPDLEVEILTQVGEGDRVATHWRFSATHQAAYEGKDRTNKRVTWTGIQIDRIADGKIAESWVVWDKYTLFSDLNLLPEAGSTPMDAA